MNRRSALDAAEDYQTKATLGITGWYYLSVQSDGSVRHLDVGSSYPGGGENTPSLLARNCEVINKLNTVETTPYDLQFRRSQVCYTWSNMTVSAVGKMDIEVNQA